MIFWGLTCSPAAARFQTSAKRLRLSSREPPILSSAFSLMVLSPPFHIRPEVGDQLVGVAAERVGLLAVSVVAMVALPRLIVVGNDPLARPPEEQAVFQAVARAPDRRRDQPEPKLHDEAFLEGNLLIEELRRGRHGDIWQLG